MHQVAEEWATARSEAARAKAAGDKPRQKAAGLVIAGLKREIAQLGERPSLTYTSLADECIVYNVALSSHVACRTVRLLATRDHASKAKV